MTVRRGEQWGRPADPDADLVVVRTDTALTAAVVSEDPSGVAAPNGITAGVIAGDLHRTLGSPPGGTARLRSPQAWWHPIDLGELTLRTDAGTTRSVWFSAHVVAVEGGRPLFAARTVVVMNAAYVGDANLGPRAHPNDGLLDVTDGRLGTWDRIRARRRMVSGTHLPHPSLHHRRVRECEVEFARPAAVTVDGVSQGWATSLVATCHPDAASVVA